MKQHSNLNTILRRVKRVIRNNKNGTDQEKLQAILPHAFNLCEYLSYVDDFTTDEGKEAKRLLTTLGLPLEIDEKHGIGYYEVANKLLADGKIVKIPSRHCRRCGRALSNEVSVEYGLGPICRSKQAHEDARAISGIDKDDMVDGIEALVKELNLEGDHDETGDNTSEKYKIEVKKTHDFKQQTLL